jgi:D,D-heptose 1,7-bisphosphate phosphatase
MKHAAFLDRDGVINIDRAYVHRWEDFEFVHGALEAAARLSAAGWTLVVVTNQSGIARGYYTEADYQALTRRMVETFAAHSAPIAAVYHCPHHPSGRVALLAVDCDCRKPAPGMLLRAAEELGLSLPESLMIGDKPSDIAAARAAGVGRAYLVASNNEEPPAGGDPQQVSGADASFESLADCVCHLLARQA